MASTSSDAATDPIDTGATGSGEQPSTAAASTSRDVRVHISADGMGKVWFALLGVVAVGLFFKFVLEDGGSVMFTVLMAWFGAIIIEPLVKKMSHHMRRGAATGLIMVAAGLFIVLFLAAFGNLFVQQMIQLISQIPQLIDGTLAWINENFNTSLSRDGILSSVNITPQQIAEWATTAGVSILGLLGSALGGFFSIFTFAMFMFYLSAQMPQLESWIGSLFPPRHQAVAQTVWRLTAEKTGGYMGARVILAGINAGTTAIVFVIIGMPYWLPLALWTGIVAQFVPTIGTYISIILPVIVGLLSGNPWIGVIALVWALLYQQVENLTIEPKISANAVDVNPAVSFGAVLLGAALFGVAGAFLAVPVIATLLSLLHIYGHRYDLLPDIQRVINESTYKPKAKRGKTRPVDPATVGAMTRDDATTS